MKLLKIIQRIVYTLIYPVWVFLSCTLVGNISIALSCLGLPGFIISSLLDFSNAPDAAGGVAIFSILIGLLLSVPIMALDWHLVQFYKQWKYRTEWV